MTEDLTDNDIVIRQINCAPILSRNLDQKLKTGAKLSAQQDSQSFSFDYYGDEHYWMRFGTIMRVIMFAFPILHAFQVLILNILLFFIGKLRSSNLVIQMQKKRQAYRKARVYFEKLMEPVKVTQSEDGSYKVSPVDLHLYKLAIYAKFSSIVTQLVIDFVLGILLLFIVGYFPTVFFEMTNKAGSFMHL